MSIKCWVGTWNMGVSDPFADEDGNAIGALESNNIIRSFIPHGYQMYVLGIQEGASDNVYRAVDIFLNQSDDMFRRIPLEKNEDKVYGYGDGAFMDKKFTGLALFLSDGVFDRISLIKCYAYGFGTTHGSKGGVSVALLIDGSTRLTFLSCHLEANNDDLRREQIKKLDLKMGSKLGKVKKVPMTQQFDHVIWMGDVNYRLHTLSPDAILDMLADGKVDELHNDYDGLLRDSRENNMFQGFHEPRKMATFYPSYKKHVQRGFVDTLTNKNWPTLMYHTRYAVPVYKQIYKMKQEMSRRPGWTDRILVHSHPACGTIFIPEEICNDGIVSDNYCAVENGVGMQTSDHSPVFCTFNLVQKSNKIQKSKKTQSTTDTMCESIVAETEESESVEMPLTKH